MHSWETQEKQTELDPRKNLHNSNSNFINHSMKPKKKRREIENRWKTNKHKRFNWKLSVNKIGDR